MTKQVVLFLSFFFLSVGAPSTPGCYSMCGLGWNSILWDMKPGFLSGSWGERCSWTNQLQPYSSGHTYIVENTLKPTSESPLISRFHISQILYKISSCFVQRHYFTSIVLPCLASNKFSFLFQTLNAILSCDTPWNCSREVSSTCWMSELVKQLALSLSSLLWSSGQLWYCNTKLHCIFTWLILFPHYHCTGFIPLKQIVIIFILDSGSAFIGVRIGQSGKVQFLTLLPLSQAGS